MANRTMDVIRFYWISMYMVLYRGRGRPESSQISGTWFIVGVIEIAIILSSSLLLAAGCGFDIKRIFVGYWPTAIALALAIGVNLFNWLFILKDDEVEQLQERFLQLTDTKRRIWCLASAVGTICVIGLCIASSAFALRHLRS